MMFHLQKKVSEVKKMQIDFYNEIKYELENFYPILKKKKVTKADTEQMIMIMGHIIEILEYYLYDYLD